MDGSVFWADVSTEASRRTRRWGVYTIVTLLLALAAGAHAQVRLTIEPAMTRGPADAAVTIVEFSDYQ